MDLPVDDLLFDGQIKIVIVSLGIDDATLLQGNRHHLTKYTGSDPEFSASNHQLYQGIDCGNIAQGRVFSMGVKINL